MILDTKPAPTTTAPVDSCLPSELQSLARKIKQHRLESLVILLLEMHRPLANVFYHLALISEPVVSPLSGKQAFTNFSTLFSNPAVLQEFIALLSDHKESIAQ